MVRIPTGRRIRTHTINNFFMVQKKYAEEMRRFASMCGLTIDSRLKAASARMDRIEDEIADEFGDI